MTAVMTLLSFRAQPRVGHLDRVKSVYAYLLNHRYYRIRFDVREPSHNATPVHTHDWSNTAYDTIAEKNCLKMRPNPEERESSSRAGRMQILCMMFYLVNLLRELFT